MKENIVFWNPWWEENKTPKIKYREEFKRLELLMKRKEAIFITGVRRSGKTTGMFHLIKELLKKTQKENILYLNLDDSELKNKDLKEIYETYKELFPKTTGKKYLFLDEIQNIDSWERWIKKMYDSNEDIKFVVSGSKSNMIKKNLYLLTGRILEHNTYPLSFREFLQFKDLQTDSLKIISKKQELKKEFEEYIKNGGFPEIVLEKDQRLKTMLLKEYYENIKDKDIIKYFNIKESKKFDNLAIFLISNFAKNYSASKIGNIINLSTTIVENYLDYSEMMYFFLTLNHFNYSIKKQITQPRKIYSIDTGIINAVAFSFSKNKGRFLENCVFLELKRQNKEIYYYKEKQECDFLIKEGLKIKTAIQVSESLKESETKTREIKGLIEALDTHKLKKGLILTYDEEETIIKEDKEIKIKPIWKWMLE